MRDGKKSYLHGNDARVDPKDNSTVPLFLSHMPTAADVKRHGKPDEVDDTKIYLSKKEIDQNQK